MAMSVMATRSEGAPMSVQRTRIQNVLISVSDKTGLVDFAQKLSAFGVKILTTGGTASLLADKGIDIVNVSDYTGYPEMLDGRVKTLHPKIHGGLLGLRNNEAHLAKMKEHDIEAIDMVVVNLYPFEATIAKADVSLEEAIENIDIGGPTMLRSAAKNNTFVSVICDPSDYNAVIEEMQANQGTMGSDTNYDLAVKVFKHTARYDMAIAQYLSEGEFVGYTFDKVQDLRYGENPHQTAAFYQDPHVSEIAIQNAKQLQGKELSFNNIWDCNAALELVKEFKDITAVIVKHTNPCGVAQAKTLVDAYTEARSVDPVSAFGGIIAVNREVDADAAKEMVSTFVEAVIAPSFSQEALAVFATKANVRLLEVGAFDGQRDAKQKDIKKVVGGLLIQDRDLQMVGKEDLKVVTETQPTDEQLEALLFNWKVCKHVKSNAIVYGTKGKVLGVGAGQMSRVDSAQIGASKAQFDLKGCVLASDAFFPFRDGVDAAAKVGVKAIIQPGGSMRDDEVIAACNEHGIAMVFTGMRHFKH